MASSYILGLCCLCVFFIIGFSVKVKLTVPLLGVCALNGKAVFPKWSILYRAGR